MVDEEYVDQNNLMDEAIKLLIMCTNIQQKIMVYSAEKNKFDLI